MYRKLFFLFALCLSLTSFASSGNQKEVSRVVYGKVAQLVLSAMKNSGVKKPLCTENGCSYSIKKFYSVDEGDGCGGGTTLLETNLVYADNTAYNYRFCEGYEGDEPQGSKKNNAAALVSILSDLGLFESAGWASYVDISKLDCVTNLDASISHCAYTIKTKE